VKRLRLGDSTLEVSALALGTDLIGSKTDRNRSYALLDFYREQGGNFIDTANFYASWFPGCKGGESETTIGLWMKERHNRDEMIISTKLAFDYPGCSGGLSANEIERECEKSLKRLQTDRVELYQAHRHDPDTRAEETMEAFERLIKAGKVRVLGASNVPLWRIAEANVIAQSHGWTSYSVIEQRYTYLRPRHGADFGPQIFISDELKDYAVHHAITLMGYSILLQGAYMRSDREIAAQFAGPDSTERLEVLRTISRDIGCSPGQTIIAWMRQSKPPVLPIIAGSQTEQLRENIAALDVTLTDDQLQCLDIAGNPAIKQAWIQPT
jgi:aryl-alcohol dehydrogenase-like predicted oxidoreductase